jgi:REP element-mobilizing transposase RayT
VTVPRQVIPCRAGVVTRRCTQRQFLLQPDDEVVHIFVYCLAEAAQRFHVTVFGFTVMSNHEHLLVRDNEGNLPEFMAHLHKLVAKAVNDHWGRTENLWAAEQPNVVHTVEPSDQFDKLIYILANPVAADLVDHAHDWPGASSLAQSYSGRSITVTRPKFFRADGPMPDEVTLRVERLDGFEHLTDEQWAEKVRAGVQAAEDRARELRVAKNIRVLGRKAVRRAKHTDTPTKLEAKRRLRPFLACRNPERRALELAAVMEFRRRYRDARTRWCDGDRTAAFPLGTYRMLDFGIRIDECTPGDLAT